jgi:Ca2+-binding RTX toxin-like protein
MRPQPGGSGRDRIFGGTGVDKLAGGAGADRLSPGNNVDAVYGGAGDDTIWVDGDFRVDTVACGDGSDMVTFDLRLGLEDAIASDCENLIPIGTPTPRPTPAT